MKSVVVKDLVKSYGKVEALTGVSFEVERGEIFGIIGADGAGKSTLFRIMTTLLLPNSGEVEVDGANAIKDFKVIRQRVGYMPGRFSLYQDLTVRENLEFFASLFGVSVEQNYELIRDIYVQIEPFKNRRAGKLSGGMKQKLALCCALIHRPTVLFLDEPTTGVDAVSRREFWTMLHRLKLQEITILVSTPYMDEAVLCDRIALMDLGKFFTIDTPQNIIKAFGHKLYAVSTNLKGPLIKDLRDNPFVLSCYPFGQVCHVTMNAPSDLTEYLRQRGHADIEISCIEPTVEDCFLKFASHGK